MRHLFFIAFLCLSLGARAEDPAPPAAPAAPEAPAAPAAQAAPVAAAPAAPVAQAQAAPAAPAAAAPAQTEAPKAAAVEEKPPAVPKGPPPKRTYVAGKTRTMTVLLGSDTSGYNLASALQFAIGQLFKSAGTDFNVQLASTQLAAFTEEETKKAHESLNSELFSLAYLDRERISVFLFDNQAPGQFIVAVNPLLDPANPQLTTAVLEEKLRKTFSETLAIYKEGRFQYLPGSREDKAGEGLADAETDINRRRAAEAGHLFRELASIADKPLYIGANLGMARYADAGLSNSVVNVGAFLGYRIRDRISAELAFDMNTYGLMSFDAKYQLPISGQYVYLDASLGAGMVLFQASDNLGHEGATLPKGLLFGPGLTFTVPLLGANLRGGLKFYIGSGSMLLGSYGFSYGISL